MAKGTLIEVILRRSNSFSADRITSEYWALKEWVETEPTVQCITHTPGTYSLVLKLDSEYWLTVLRLKYPSLTFKIWRRPRPRRGKLPV